MANESNKCTMYNSEHPAFLHPTSTYQQYSLPGQQISIYFVCKDPAVLHVFICLFLALNFRLWADALLKDILRDQEQNWHQLLDYKCFKQLKVNILKVFRQDTVQFFVSWTEETAMTHT